MKHFNALLKYGYLGAALTTLPSLVLAQTPPAEPVLVRMETSRQAAEMKSLGLEFEFVRIRNVKAGLIAWWLDPTHNAESLANYGTDTSRNLGVGTKLVLRNNISDFKPDAKQAFQLPVGMSRIIPQDPNNGVLLIGTADSIAKTKEIIGILDKPIKQIEIQTQFVLMDDEALNKFKIDTPKDKGVSIINVNLLSTLNSLASTGHLKVSQDTRITSLNNTPTLFGSSTNIGSNLGYKDENGTFHKFAGSVVEKEQNDSKAGVNLNAQMFNGLQITSTINNDQTMTMMIATAHIVQLSTEENTLPLSTSNKVGAIVNVRDGDTIALTGIEPRFFPNLNKSDSKKLKHSVVLVTPRIVRRFGDE